MLCQTWHFLCVELSLVVFYLSGKAVSDREVRKFSRLSRAGQEWVACSVFQWSVKLFERLRK